MDRVAEIITRYSMLPDASRIGVAVSGGADSVALLHLLSELSEKFRASLVILHVNHGLRGQESDDDEEFVRELGARLDIPFFSEHSCLGEGNLEELAREARRAFFRRACRELALDRVALGHTRSDQAETVLFRFLRGAGTAGLAGMQFVANNKAFIRPLLTVSGAEVRHWAHARGIVWREDSTNTSVHFRRNRIRLETYPDLAANYNSNLESVLAGMAEVAQAENEYWEKVIPPIYAELARKTHRGIAIHTAKLNSLHSAVQRRLLRHALEELRGDLRGIDLEHVEAIRKLCTSAHGHDRVMTPRADAMRSFDTLLLAAPGVLSQAREYRVQLQIGREEELPYQAGRICLEPVNSESDFCANFKEDQYFLTERAELEWDALFSARTGEEPLVVRNWQPGDAIERSGHHRPEKLKELFQRHQVPLWTRRHWPVLVAGTQVVWTRKFGCASKFERRTGERWLRLLYKEAENERI
ncbi:MAG TPA: tRNA lysidine(34) synthetase TilS [Bryobacteraceae bacterium]|nr:tRNA lysidine(34) synthetase TilS [Bryobacteraceae bacterium]